MEINQTSLLQRHVKYIKLWHCEEIRLETITIWKYRTNNCHENIPLESLSLAIFQVQYLHKFDIYHK